jgi:hypothetical protein
MSVVLPPSAHPIAVKEFPGWEDSILMKIEIPRADLDTFLAQSPFATSTFRTDRKYVSQDRDLHWWTVDSVARYRSAYTSFANGSCLLILIDLDNASKAVLYLEWFET